MTKTVLKAVWLGGGGVLATWIAVTPTHRVPTSGSSAIQRNIAQPEATADSLNAQAEQLRARTRTVMLRPSTRNPFRFTGPKAVAHSRDRLDAMTGATIEPVAPMTPATPSLTLTGVATKKTADGTRRTAVISGDGGIYLVAAGDSVAGRYTVITVEEEAVVLRDAIGSDLRLVLR
jgi:hypothetical protein